MERFQEDGVSGFLHEPDTAASAAVALTHGAGANCNAPLLVAIAEQLTKANMAVLRYDLPFRQNKAKGPPLNTATQDREGVRKAANALQARFRVPLVLGGHSYGGRQTSMLVAEKPNLAAALLLFSYPLHPPAKPEQLRTDHFPQLNTKALFVHGTKDPFGAPEEMEAALIAIPAEHRLQLVPGAGHDLRRGKFDVEAVVTQSLRALLAV